MAALNVAQKLIRWHLALDELRPGGEVALRIDQALLQDVLGALVMLELEAMGLERVKVEPAVQCGGGHAIVAADNYGQGSSRENAALAPRYLGLHAVLARSFARIHWQNLANFGVLPLTFRRPRRLRLDRAPGLASHPDLTTDPEDAGRAPVIGPG